MLSNAPDEIGADPNTIIEHSLCNNTEVFFGINQAVVFDYVVNMVSYYVCTFHDKLKPITSHTHTPRRHKHGASLAYGTKTFFPETLLFLNETLLCDHSFESSQ